MKPRKYWLLMKVQDWDGIAIGGLKIKPPTEGPSHWLPIFKTKKDAIKFNRGRADQIFQVVEVLP